MHATKVYLWHYAPFLRLLIPLMAGIICQFYLAFSFSFLIIAGGFSITLIIVYFFLPDKRKHQFNSVHGLVLHFLLFVLGCCLVWIKDIRHDSKWIGNFGNNNFLLVRIIEPLTEKENSYKALGELRSIIGKNNKETRGNIIIYFKKDSSSKLLQYGSQIVFNKPLQEIKNAGNPGSFDYKQYCLFQNITHQVYLNETEFEVLQQKNKNLIDAFLFSTRDAVVNILKKFIKSEKEQGLAEALLIGYKDDLDKNLVQSYSNTGVVHIIAISGLHLGLIYWLLLWLTKPIKKNKNLTGLRVLIIVLSLWIFSLLAGGGPSVLRSAVMFTCIAFGEVLNRKSSIYNTLALSAFILLCKNPFWLWDVGFQLSYSAVLSIVIFFRPIYNWFYFQNKLLDWLWKLNAVTIAAQVLTTPISIYHFHQFPTLFLFANLVAVPLSSVIVIGEIVLVVTSFIPPFAKLIGYLLEQSISFMDFYIERLSSVSFAIWNNLFITITQAVLLLGCIASIGYWLMEKNKKALWPALVCMATFFVLRTVSFIQASQQKLLIVYNVPKRQAIDIINGRNYWFLGDEELQEDDFIRNFHLQPSRILHRIKPANMSSNGLKSFQFANEKVLIIDSSMVFKTPMVKPVVNVAILSKNPKVYIGNLNQSFIVKQVVIDGSVPVWKVKLWKKDCDSLHIPCHDVSEKGAFVMKIQ